MRVLIVSAVFPPEPVVSAQTSQQIARELAQRDHQVTVITSFPSRPAGKLYLGYCCRLYHRQQSEHGYEIIRCFSFFSSQSRLVSRFLENISLGITASLAIAFSKKADVIYCNMWPIFAAGLVRLAAGLRRAPVTISIQDVYPESLVFQGRVSDQSGMVRIFKWIDGLIARSCQAVIVLSERHRKFYHEQRGVPLGKLFAIPNWTDEKLLENSGAGDDLRARLNIPAGSFLVVYGGNIGVAAGVETLIEAFRYLDRSKNIYCLIAGSGSRLDECRAQAARIDGDCILFLSPWAVEDTASVYALADLLVLPTRHGQSYVSVPSKLISYMLSERPIVALSMPNTDLFDMMLQSGAGWVIEPDNPERLAVEIQQAQALTPEVRREIGRKARVYALRQLTAETCLPKVIRVIESNGTARGAWLNEN
jgi:glycosyltransferase involved in cell wall biosynthesis